jgi:hypothetical protein
MGIASLHRTGVLITLAVLSVTAIDARDVLAQRPRTRSTVMARTQAPAPQEDAVDSPSDRPVPATVPRRLPKSPASRPPQVPPPVVPQPPPMTAESGPANAGAATPTAEPNGPIAGALSLNPDNASAATPSSERPNEKPIRDISLNIAATAGSLPANAAAKHYATGRVLHDPQTRGWGEEVYLRETPRFYHNPLYFEQPFRERGGHDRFAKLGPVISGAQFFVQSVSLPYRMALDPPHSLQPTPPKHSVGTPWHRRHSAQDHVRAVAVQTAAIALAIWLIP